MTGLKKGKSVSTEMKIIAERQKIKEATLKDRKKKNNAA